MRPALVIARARAIIQRHSSRVNAGRSLIRADRNARANVQCALSSLRDIRPRLRARSNSECAVTRGIAGFTEQTRNVRSADEVTPFQFKDQLSDNYTRSIFPRSTISSSPIKLRECRLTLSLRASREYYFQQPHSIFLGSEALKSYSYTKPRGEGRARRAFWG